MINPWWHKVSQFTLIINPSIIRIIIYIHMLFMEMVILLSLYLLTIIIQVARATMTVCHPCMILVMAGIQKAQRLSQLIIV